MTTHKKRDLSVKSAFWVDPNFLPEAVRYDLFLELKNSRLAREEQEQLIAHANQIAQTPPPGDKPIAEQRDELKKIASDAHRLRSSLNALSRSTIATLEMHTREAIVLESPSPVSFEIAEKLADTESTGLLGEAWEWISALEAAAEYAQLQQEPSRQKKPKQARARALVADLSRSYQLMTGKWPPADAAAWFVGFCGRLAGHLGLEAGSRLVGSGIKLAQAPFFSNDERKKLRSDKERSQAAAKVAEATLARLQAAEWARDNEATLGALAFVGEASHITADDIAAWTDADCRDVEAYCRALIAKEAAGGGPRVKVPPRPAVMRARPKA